MDNYSITPLDGDDNNSISTLNKDEINLKYCELLPTDFFATLSNSNYTIIDLEFCVYEYFGEKTIQDFVEPSIEKLKNEFIEEFKKSDDRLTFTKAKYANYKQCDEFGETGIYSKIGEEMKKLLYINGGYDMHNSRNSITPMKQLLNSNTLIQHEQNIFDEQLFRSKNSFEKLHTKLRNLKFYCEGFSDASIFNWIHFNYLLNGELNPDKDESKFKGLPKYALYKLPPAFVKNLEDIVYTPEIIIEKLFDYFKEKVCTDYIEYYVKIWLQDFQKRYILSTDRNMLIKREITKHSTEIVNIIDTIRHPNPNKVGYLHAIDGKNLSIEDVLLKGLRIDIYFYHEYTYRSITDAMEYLNEFVIGYAHAQYVQVIKKLAKGLSNKETTVKKNENSSNKIETSTLKLNWVGTPAQFGFIIQELIGKGYLEKPTNSIAKDVKLYFSIFNIETTESTLKKELSEATNSLSAENARLLKLTPIDKLNINNKKATGK